MRFKGFERGASKPIGVGVEKETHVNPNDENKVISFIKEKETDFGGVKEEKESPRSIKGTFYLTKIVSLLLPENIPDIYQAGQSVEGEQTIDRERMPHTPGHALLQEARLSGKSEEEAVTQLLEDLGNSAGELDLKLSDIGFEFSIDENVGNYTRDGEGNAKYLEAFKPWKILPGKSREIELSFDIEELSEAIEGISDANERDRCHTYLTRVLTLFEEEKSEFERKEVERLSEAEPLIREIKEQIELFKEKHDLNLLHAIETTDEAVNSEERKSARADLDLLFFQLQRILKETDVSGQYEELDEAFKELSRAVGTANRGKIDHTR